MIKDAHRYPAFYKPDEACAGQMLLFQKYNMMIGQHGESGEQCDTIQVVIKDNGYLVNAYPVDKIPEGVYRDKYPDQ